MLAFYIEDWYFQNRKSLQIEQDLKSVNNFGLHMLIFSGRNGHF